MGVVIDRHDGAPPGEGELAARMRAECLSPHGWGNDPGDTDGWHEHSYEKVPYCVRGRIVFHPGAGDIEPGQETRWCCRRTHLTRQPSAPRACAAPKRPAGEQIAEPCAAADAG
jgi:hypothetical protein